MTGYRWVEYSVGGVFPNHAVKGGEDLDGSPIFVGRARLSGDLVPAKVVPDRAEAYVCWGGEERRVDVCEVLVQPGFHWVSDSNGRVPPYAIPAGSTSCGETLYVGRVHHEGSVTIGKVHPSHHCCYIPFDSEEMRFDNYEVLVCHF